MAACDPKGPLVNLLLKNLQDPDAVDVEANAEGLQLPRDRCGYQQTASMGMAEHEPGASW